MNTDNAFVEWLRGPRGMYMASKNGRQAEVHEVGKRWAWTVLEDGRYIDDGKEETMDEACELAVQIMEER